MTISVQTPYINLVGTGSLTRFSFAFGIVETDDLLVLVDGVLMVETSTYTVENLTSAGGDVVFVTAPDSAAVVLILRKTTITQQVDYTEAAFPKDTHEFALDKITYILQELINGAFTGLDSNGDPVVITFDLSVTAGVATVTINNSGGTDAVLPAWVSASKAGVFHGEITTSPPADQDVTAQADGYIWLEIA